MDELIAATAECEGFFRDLVHEAAARVDLRIKTLEKERDDARHERDEYLRLLEVERERADAMTAQVHMAAERAAELAADDTHRYRVSGA